MPFYLRESIELSQLAGLRSVLLVPCRFCPAASLAVREKEPYIEPFRRFLRTGAYEAFITTLKRRLEDRGTEVAVFESRLLHQFVACMWTSRRRSALATRAARFEAVIVLGCDAMVQAVRDAVKSTDCRVIQGMEIEGLMNVLPTVAFPCNVTLNLHGVASVRTTSPVEQAGP
jgi:hypothetical protein